MPDLTAVYDQLSAIVWREGVPASAHNQHADRSGRGYHQHCPICNGDLMRVLEAAAPLFRDLYPLAAATPNERLADLESRVGSLTATEMGELSILCSRRDALGDHEIIAGPVTRGDLESIAQATGGYAKNKNLTVEYDDDDD